MAFIEPRLASFHVSTSEQQHQALSNVKPTATITDVFRFEVTVALRYISSTRVINISTLLQTNVHMRCKRFFLSNDQDLQRTALDFLRALLLPYPLSLQYFTQDCLDEISGRIIHQVQQLFDFINPHAGSQDQGQVFPLSLEIVLDVPSVEENQEMELTDEEIQELERAIMEEEESMQSLRMVPASNEAINSLKKFKVMKQNDHCTICMEEFDVSADNDDDVAASAMPCDHAFHQQCIVKWLQTSHMCPLCRYPMPTANN